ncbi:hypothetical protein BsWGS_17824 [Bradybaena similaris]
MEGNNFLHTTAAHVSCDLVYSCYLYQHVVTLWLTRVRMRIRMHTHIKKVEDTFLHLEAYWINKSNIYFMMLTYQHSRFNLQALKKQIASRGSFAMVWPSPTSSESNSDLLNVSFVKHIMNS